MICTQHRTLEREAKRDKNRPLIKLYDWVAQPRAIEMEQVVPSPLMYEYRNKCEFTVGYRLVDDSVKEEMKEEEVKKEEVQITEVKKEAEEDWVMVDGNVKTEEASDSAKDASSEIKDKETTPPAQPKAFQKVPAVGFLAQGWAGGVYSPHTLQNMPNWSCGLADIFNNFISSSKVPPYDTKLHRGMWRTITLRCSLRTKECMVIVLHAPAKGGAGAKEDGSDDYTSVFEDEKQRLVNMLTKNVIPTPTRFFPENHDYEKMKKQSNGEGGEGIRVTSIYFQKFDGLSNPKPEHPVQHVYGKDCLEEKLGKCTFQISPGAFFQVNTEGAEILYNIVLDRIREVTDKPQQTLLLDVCCGTGTIGLTMLKEGVVGKLVGVDISKPAIQDAKINATKNGYTDEATTKFIAGPAEKELPSATHELPKDVPIVAVVDPARDGLHGNVIKTLKANEKIQRLVYVSCNPTATLTRDAGMLCSPPTKKYPGRPFKITKSQPVDMFPLTNHCEMVMTFDRMSKEEFDMYHGVSKHEKADEKNAVDVKPATKSKEEEHKEEVKKEVN